MYLFRLKKESRLFNLFFLINFCIYLRNCFLFHSFVYLCDFKKTSKLEKKDSRATPSPVTFLFVCLFVLISIYCIFSGAWSSGEN